LHFALKKIGVARKSTKEKSRRPILHLSKKPKKNTWHPNMVEFLAMRKSFSQELHLRLIYLKNIFLYGELLQF
jgi:hypothetical protein